MKKRILALPLILCLSMGLTAPALAVEQPRFVDVPAGSWFETAVELCAGKGIMVGTGERTFSPEATLTGTECSVLALRLYDLLHGGDGVFASAPEDWGKITLTLADGTQLTSYGGNPVSLPGLEDAEFCFDWRGYRHSESGNLQVELNASPELRRRGAEGDYDIWKADQERVMEWGKAHEGKVILTAGGKTFSSGSVSCWMPTDMWIMTFYLGEEDMDQSKADWIQETVLSNAPALGAWYRDANYYAVQNDLKVGFGEYPASRADFATTLALTVGELPQLRQVEDIPGVQECWYSDDVYMLYRAGVLTGKDGYGSFDSEGTLTRAEAACMVARVLDASLRADAPLAPLPTGGYTLTYLMDGEADCGLTYPVCALAGGTETNGEGGILLLDGTLLPWPGSVYSSGLGQMGEYAYFAMWNESTEDPWDTLQGLMAADGSWAVSPSGCEQEELEAYAYAVERTIQRPYACFAGLYWDAGGHPVSQRFDWCGDLSAEGQGFVGLDGKIYRIQFYLGE